MESILRIRNRQPYVAARIAVVFFALMTLVLSLVLGAVIPSMADEDGNEVPIENAEGSVSTVEPPQTDGGETSTNTAAELSEEPSASDEAQAPAVEAEQASEGDVADEPAPAIEPSDSENADSPMLSRSLAESDAPEALREAEPTTREVSKPFWCTNGSFYALQSNGMVHFYNGDTEKWNESWGPTNLVWNGSPQSKISPKKIGSQMQNSARPLNLNGIGISPDGKYAFAFQRDGDMSGNYGGRINYLRFMELDTMTNEWEEGLQWRPTKLNAGHYLSGAVSPSGEYYFSGVKSSSNGQSTLYLYKYVNGQVIPVGYNNTLASVSGNNPNGDIAFDSLGNLFIVHSSAHGKIQIASVSKADLVTASQVQSIDHFLPVSKTEQVQSALDGAVNGIAFDYDGNVIISDENNFVKVDPNTGSAIPANQGGITGEIPVKESNDDWPVWNDKGSWDLASCTAPSTFRLRKDVVKYQTPGDMFQLSVSLPPSGNSIASITTAGQKTGLQDEEILIPIRPSNSELESIVDFKELLKGTEPADYQPKWECTQKLVKPDGTIEPAKPLKKGVGHTGQVKIPAVQPMESRHVTCTFVNDPNPQPEPATVKISKVEQHGPELFEPGKEWTVSATVSPDAGVTVTPTTTPAGVTQQPTGSDEAFASWKIDFGSANSAVELNISESLEHGPGWTFVSGECTIAKADQTTSTVEWSADASLPNNGVPRTLEGIAPGDDVSCTYTNKVTTDLTLNKKDAESGQVLPGAVFQLYRDANDNGKFDDADPVVGDPMTTNKLGKIVWTDLFYGDYFAVETEAPAGYEKLTGPVVISMVYGGDAVVEYTATNQKLRGSVAWMKVDADNNALLAGSEWELKGPDSNTTVTVTDCVTDESTCPADSLDRDPAAGKFKIINLAWGNYQLIETKAPAGYQLLPESTIPSFKINADNVAETKDLGQITNEKSSVPNLPLTGGLGSDLFIALGGLCAGSGGLLLGLMWRQRKRAMA